ncbi:hypothetical protein GCM10017083_28080 [Thalassobaculum fulvum]|uniref:Carrier domain-containing protein n=1 Tax=Thalassobaculum fulvum TaxID=1633335 RepID=A0A919CRA5_9PROT|nr:phosphopantetheine-binding protein [Thalassobaculum fulvum]GHD52570.1 hypothetical protein GCM10017083_28080 [Thalassobaculum fulvum]
MTEDEIRAAVLAALTGVAPDIEDETVDPATPFRDQFDFDSMDLLNFAIALHRSLGVEIPEIDYPKVASLEGCLGYLSGKLQDA